MDANHAWAVINRPLHQLMENETLMALSDSFTTVDDTLFNFSQTTAGSEHMDSLRIMRAKRAEMLQQWRNILHTQFVQWDKPRGETGGISGLSLVSDDDLEKELAAHQMAEIFAKKHPVHFKALEVAVAHINGKHVADFPLHQRQLAKLLTQWVDEAMLPPESRLVVTKIIERELNQQLDSLLPKALELFRAQGLHTDPAPKRPRSQPTPVPEAHQPPLPSGARPSRERSDRDQAWLEQVDGNNSYGQAHAPQSMHAGVQHSGVHIPHYGYGQPTSSNAPMNMSLDMQRQLTSALMELLGRDFNFPSAPMAPPPELDVPLQEWDPKVQSLLSVLQQRRQHRQAETKQKPQAYDTMSQTAVRSVLDLLQKDLPQSIRETARDNYQALTKQFKLEMLNTALEMGMRDENSALDARDEDAIDIVGMLFEIFLSERQIISDMRENIARLVAPYVKVALNDRKMFMHKAHPARRFLDVLAQACEGNNGVSTHERNTLNKVNNSIEELVVNFNEDVAIFELAESEIKGFIAQQKTVIEQSEKRATEAQRGAERLEKATHQSQTVFAQSTYVLPWAQQHLDTLKNHWLQHHTMVQLRHEDNPSAIAHSERILHTLVEVAQKGTNPSVTNVTATHQSILEMLSSSGLFDSAAATTAAKIWDDLAAIHAATPHVVPKVAPPTATPLDIQVQNQEIDVHLREQGLSFSQEKHKDLVEYFKNMPIGTWLDFIKSDGSVVNTKLSWVSPISNRLLFVTLRGTKYAVERAEDLAKMVLLERVRLREFGVGENGFDHSYEQALEQLAQATHTRLAS